MLSLVGFVFVIFGWVDIYFVLLRLVWWPPTWEIAVHMAPIDDVFVLCCLFSQGIFGGIWDWIVSIPEILFSYFYQLTFYAQGVVGWCDGAG